MDIQISSNFERYLFELDGSDSEKLSKMMEEFSSSGKMRVDKTVLEKAQKDFCSASVENTETLETIREIWNRENYLVDPHTACLLYTSPSPRDATLSRMPSSA